MRSGQPLLFVSALVVFLLVLAIPPQARGSSTDDNRINGLTTAVDTQGVHHRGTEYHGTPPWLKECAKGPPLYPYEARRLRQQGTVIVRVTLDLETGKIQEATIARSSGFPILDNGALKTIQSWRWLRGKWKEVVVPIDFTMAKGPGPEQPITGRKPNM